MELGVDHPKVRDILARLTHSVSEVNNSPNASITNTGKIRADEQVAQASEQNIRILSPLDNEYPSLLRGMTGQPVLVWLKGALHSEPNKSIAVIGPREPTPHGDIIASRIATFFAESGWSIVSGLAVGCDASAHKAALDAGGHTVAVLAHGLQMVSPSVNSDLADRILKCGGALISQFPLGNTPIGGKQFVVRDKTQAGLSKGVVMVQSDLTGGSLHAPRAALVNGRWLIVPYPTKPDIDARAPKISANMVIVNEDQREKCHLLNCSAESLSKVVILHGRDDYQPLLELLSDESQNEGAAEPQTDLF